MKKHRLWQLIKISFISLLFLLLIAPEWPAFGSDDYRLQKIIQQREFDFLIWEVNAILAKVEGVLASGQRYLQPEERQEIVVDYLANIQTVRDLEGQINRVYLDANIIDHDSATQELQAELAVTRARIDDQQLVAEAILQEQVAEILKAEGFGVADQMWPPVLMHMTPLPTVLITSPRDHIEKEHQLSLIPGLTTPQMDALETAVFDDLDLSALIVPIGGAGSYPTMINETGNINWLAEVTAHEWVHNWLTLQPLGASYPFDTSVRIINETVASLVDQELGNKIIERYYPEFAPLPPDANPTPIDPSEAPAFDFRAEMAATRIQADELLAAGKIEEAEKYMEARRQFFVENGYGIRKLNQAYFAFYGAYAAEPGGAQGGNPIGPMLRDIRANTPSVRAFLDTVAPITSFADLERIHQEIITS